jgi:acylphosphatase
LAAPVPQVQKVYFRKYTQAQAQQLGLVGWVMNTPAGSVVGEMQGPTQKVRDM